MDAITFHSYQATADDRFSYRQVANVRKRLADTYGSHGMRMPPLWMGEHGWKPSRATAQRFQPDQPQSPLSAYGFKHKTTGRQVAAIWEYGAQGKMPSDDTTRKPVTVTLPGGDFADPVYVDVRTGEVFDIPTGNWSKSGSTFTFTGLPVGESPVLIADRSLIRLA